MTKVLIVDDEQSIRDLLIDDLTSSGYHVIEAENGKEALDRVYNDRPDIVLLDLMMPVMNGVQVLKTLKADPDTAAIPLVILTAISGDEGERRSKNLGADYYLSKPWEPDAVQSVIRIALDNLSASGGRNSQGGPIYDGKTVADSAFFSTGNSQLDQKLGGGVPRSGLTLVEGVSSTGKSVLCQHFAYSALMNGSSVCFFSSQHSTSGLASQMGSLGLNSYRFSQSGQLTVEDIPTLDPSSDGTQAVLDLALRINEAALDYHVVIVDCLTTITNGSQESAIISFASQCKGLSDSGNSIIIAAHPAGMSAETLERLRSLCDGYLALRIEKSGTRIINVLEVFKVGNAEMPTGIRANFEIEPGMGIRIDPTSRISV